MGPIADRFDYFVFGFFYLRSNTAKVSAARGKKGGFDLSEPEADRGS